MSEKSSFPPERTYLAIRGFKTFDDQGRDTYLPGCAACCWDGVPTQDHDAAVEAMRQHVCGGIDIGDGVA